MSNPSKGKAKRDRLLNLLQMSWGEYYSRRMAWHLYIKQRDMKCKHCGTTKHLEAHHILPFSHFPRLCLDVRNGMALCHSCHVKQHKLLDALSLVIKGVL